MKLRFSSHAIDRVYTGDENGRRTTLSLQDILAILESGKFAFYGSERIFYSKKDRKFLVAVVAPDGSIVTIKPGENAPIKLRLLAIKRMMGLTKPLSGNLEPKSK